jgi:hypothetical protein
MNTPETNSNEVNVRLRTAVNSVEVPPFLEAKIRNQIRIQAQPRVWFKLKLATAGIALALFLGTGIAFQLGHLRMTAESQESYFASISTTITALMQVGLGDHVHCAFFRKFPKTAPAVEQMETSLGPEYKELVAVVQRHVPAEYRLVLGHNCRYHQRRFVHLVLKNESQLMSLIITAKQDGESFDVEGVLPDLVQSGVPLYQSGVQRFQIAAMETSDHFVYFISDLPGKDNMALMQAMAPELQRFLTSLEG